jgi:hypothetical protein
MVLCGSAKTSAAEVLESLAISVLPAAWVEQCAAVPYHRRRGAHGGRGGQGARGRGAHRGAHRLGDATFHPFI